MSSSFTSAYLVWFLIGLGFILAELAASGFILIFFAVGAWVVAAVAFFVPLSLPIQLAIFTVASLLSLFALRKYVRRAFQGDTSDRESAKIDQDDLGRNAVVVKDILPDKPGEIKYRGSFWKALSDQAIAADETVIITGRPENDPQAFIVEPVSSRRE